MEEKRPESVLKDRGPESSNGCPTDQDLVRLAQGGDQKALAELYGRYRVKIGNYLYRFTGERGRAEELAQETFLRVVEHIDRYRPTGSVGGWIYRIAWNLALNAHRDSRRAKEISLDEPLELEEGAVDRSEVVPGKGPQPDEEASRREREMAVQQGLLKIAGHHRAVLILCDVEGHSYREAAEILGCPINTVASRLARGREELARVLGYLKGE